jgi:hypothetical protein
MMTHMKAAVAQFVWRLEMDWTTKRVGIQFSVRSNVQTASGDVQPPTQWVLGAISRNEAEHSPPTSTEVKKTWLYTITP